MSLEAEKRKPEVMVSYRRHESDTGSAEVQIALLTSRITVLTDHLKSHVKDHSSRRGLLKMVGKRAALLRYLSARSRPRYLETIKRLGLRK